MQASRPPLVSDLVLVGGGHAHVHVLKMLGMSQTRKLLWSKGIQVTLIARDVHTPYSGMLPGYCAGHYSLDDIHLDLNKLCRFANVRLIHLSACKITYNKDGGGGTVECSNGRPPIRYDALSINIGSAPSGTPPKYVVPVKPIAHFSSKYQLLTRQLQETAKEYSVLDPFILLVVGGGAGGIELALAVQHRLQQIFVQQGVSAGAVKVVIATRGKDLLERHNGSVRRIFRRVLEERKVQVHYQAEAVNAELADANGGKRKVLILSKQSKEQPPIYFDECLWCTSAGASDWMAQHTPFLTTIDGFLKVNDTYECIEHPGVFAAGDCSHMVKHPRPKAGVFAVRAGPYLKENLLNYLQEKPLRSHKPQSKFLGLISTGDANAVASRGDVFAMEGKLIWWWKDYIDRKWMQQYTVLPDLEEMMAKITYDKPPRQGVSKLPAHVRRKGSDVMEAFAADPMRCGGCGAKVGATTVSRVLGAIHKRQVQRATENKTIAPPPIDHDDAAIVPVLKPGAMVHTIDYFRSFISDPFVFGQIAAVHALSDVHAMGARAQTALALAVVPFAADEDITESTLMDLLGGASDVLQDENIQLVGGHTCEGAELACGFAIQGFTERPERLLRKSGGRIGDKIVLTKSIGSGALFAADMRAKSKGDHVMEALASMCQTNVYASQIAASTTGVHSCTDVTGFGLAGHLLEMLMAHDDEDNGDTIGAKLHLNQIPMLAGALEAASQGIFSSLQPQNSRNRRAVSNHARAAAKFPCRYPLVFDPQTAGGLLFFVEPSACNDLVARLEEHYPSTAVIGEIVEYKGSCENGLCTIGNGSKMTGERIHIALHGDN